MRIPVFSVIVWAAVSLGAAPGCGDGNDACTRAKKCCKKASALLETECDWEFQEGNGSATACKNTMKGYRTLLESKGKSIPGVCSP